MPSISELIILSNDQHQHKNYIKKTTGLNAGLNDNIQLWSIGVIVSDKFVSVSVLFVVYKFALHGQ